MIPHTRILDDMDLSPGLATVGLTPDWAQGRATFGGLVVASALRALRPLVTRQLRSIMVSFVGPVEPTEATIESSILREGKSATQAEARVVQKGQTRAVLLAVYGADRDSSIAVSPPRQPAVPGPLECRAFMSRSDLAPAFVRHFEMRWALGEAPYSGSKRSDMAGYCRFSPDTVGDSEGAAAAADEEAILMLTDAWPSPVLAMASSHAFASSVTWSLDFMSPLPREPIHDYWFLQANALAAQNGYAQTVATLWSPSGQVAAFSRQLVAIFA